MFDCCTPCRIIAALACAVVCCSTAGLDADRALISVETGGQVIARFTPAGYEEVDRTHLLTPTTRTRGGGSGRWRHHDRTVLWAHPAFANGHVIARNDAEVVRVSLTAADYE